MPRIRWAVGLGLISLFFATLVWAQAERELIREQDPVRDLELFRGHEVAAGEVLVKFRGGTPEQVAQLAREKGLAPPEKLGRIPRLFHLRSRVRTAAQLVEEFSRRADVLYAEPNYRVHIAAVPNDRYFANLWGLRNTFKLGADIAATAAWDLTTGSADYVVGVVDTGIDYLHPDLAANIWSAPADFTVTLGSLTITCPTGSHGFNALQNTCNPADDNGHGTHVAGTIGAVGNNSLGVAGVNWTTRLLALKFLNVNGSGFVADGIEAIDFALQVKAIFGPSAPGNVIVLNNSWGMSGFSQALLDAIQRAAAQDVLFVAAAGNNSFDNNISPFYPATYDVANVVSVAATDSTDRMASYSNYGFTTVHLGAPGSNIFSTVPNNQYADNSGTSMAAPHVSGAAALLRSYCDVLMTAAKDFLLNNTDPLATLVGATITGGRLNVNRALRACGSGISIVPGSLAFPNQVVGSTGSALPVVVTNHRDTALGINSVGVTGEFSQVNDCGASLAPEASCNIAVTFTPLMLAYRSGLVTISTDAPEGAFTVSLGGRGGAQVKSLALNPVTVVGGKSSVVTVNITAAAPKGGVNVPLSSDNPAIAPVPAFVTIPAGKLKATFTVITAPTAGNTTARISVPAGAFTKFTTLNIVAPTLYTFTVLPTSVAGGVGSTGTITLTGIAAQDTPVTLSSSNSAVAAVPATATVPALSSSITFPITTSPVSVNTYVSLSARLGTKTLSRYLTVTKPSAQSVTLDPSTVVGGSTSTATVTLSGPAPAAGALVTLTSGNNNIATVPKNVTVAPGATTASFTVTTRTVIFKVNVGISATYGGLTRKATLTVTP